jgi:hypothetical protein
MVFPLLFLTKGWQFNHTRVLFHIDEGYAAKQRGGGLTLVSGGGGGGGGTN